jgi:DNA-binding response OmpR family regulator
VQKTFKKGDEMSMVIRRDTTEVLDILRTELEAYIPVPLEEKSLQNIFTVLVNHIRESVKEDENIIELSDEFFWEIEEELLKYKNKALDLTKQETKLIALLFKNINKKVSYELISCELWGETFLGNRERIKTIVKQLRKKLPYNIIKNIFAYGYKIEVETEVEK